MPGLLDIASAPARVEVRGTMVDVFGVSAEGIAHLMTEFPEIKALFSGKEVELSAGMLASTGPDAVAAIIACGASVKEGERPAPGNAEAEAVAKSLSIDEQVELLSAILERTFPRGLGPFVEAVQRATATIGGAADATSKAQAMTSPSPSKN